MVYKLKCKQCGNICTATFEQIEANDFYKCPNCRNTMEYNETTRLSDIVSLRNFELIEICKSDLDTSHIDEVIENDLNRIKEIIQNGNKEVNSNLSDIIDTIYLIVNTGDLGKISELNDVIHNLFLKFINEDNEETNKLLGIAKKSVDDFIAYINDYISCYKLYGQAVAKFKNMYRQYNGDYEFLTECVDISAEQYLEYDEDDTPTKESAYEFLYKIGGIAYNKAHHDC